MKGERLLPVAGCMLAIALAGCGSGSAGPASTTPTSAAAQTAPAATTPSQAMHDGIVVDSRPPEESFVPNPYPEPAAPAGHPHGDVRQLIVRDIKRGKGPAASASDIVYADFVKSYYRSGRKFLVAWGPHRASYLALGAEAPGIARGIAGMRPGGRRTIVIPRDIADVHDPDGEGFEIAVMQVVLRGIRP